MSKKNGKSMMVSSIFRYLLHLDKPSRMSLQQDLVASFKDAIASEQKADTQLTDSYLNLYSSKKLAAFGLAITNLLVTNIRTGLGGKNLIELSPDPAYQKADQDELNLGSFKTGDIVRLDRMSSESSASSSSKNDSKDRDSTAIEGVIIKLRPQSVTVSVEDSSNDEKIMNMYNNTAQENNRMWIVKLTNSITYQRMNTTMNKLGELQDADKNSVIRLLLGETKYQEGGNSSSQTTQFFDSHLNESQRNAIDFAINKSDVTIIHGPPGTGKTYTLIEIIKQLAFNHNERVLVCGASNISVDTILERLSPVFNNAPSTESGDSSENTSTKKRSLKKKMEKLKITSTASSSPEKLIRIGHPARLLETNLKHSLEILSKSTGDGSAILKDIDNDIGSTIAKAKKCKNYGERRQLWAELKQLKKELRLREKKILSDLITNANVILATLHGSGSWDLTSLKQQGLEFDTIIIDEVSQSLEPQCWIPIINHFQFKRLIIAGDNMQLSPVLKTNDTNSVLATTLFDRLMLQHGGSKYKKLLNTQYRMNESIMEFSSLNLYGGRLVAHESVAHILVKDLPDVEDTEDTNVSCIWYDTQGGDFPEKVDEGENIEMGELSGSKYNEMEALVVKQHIEKLRAAGVSNKCIGVISPYNAQVSLLKKSLRDDDVESSEKIEVSTIDGFQGREKEIIIISLVRSNDDGEVGFLRDERRLNVAITRPKRQLCVIGDLDLLSRCDSKFLNELSQFVENKFEIRYPDLGDY